MKLKRIIAIMAFLVITLTTSCLPRTHRAQPAGVPVFRPEPQKFEWNGACMAQRASASPQLARA